LQFLRACRFSIGTESGASVVDFDGTIKKRCQQYLRQHPNADFEEVSAALFADVDGKTAVQTISPRLFEAAAFENTLILHEGRYEDMIKPDVHYISVKKDYSNVDEVVRRMKDRAFCAMLARNARKDLIDSKQYNYAAFVERFDTILESHVETPKARPTSRVVFYFLNYLHHDRLFPHEDKFLTIPKTCDAMDHCHALAPYLMSIAYSIQVVVGLMIAMPFLVERIGRGLLETPFGKLALFVRLLKDLRMLALARKARQGANAFSLQLAYRKDLRQMTLRSLPIAPSGSPITAARKPFDRSLVDDVLETEFTLAWDHQQAGCGIGLPHADSKTCIVYLNDDCIYRFESFQVLLQWLGSDKHRFFDGLLFDEEKTPTFAARLGGAVHVISTLAVLICWTAPVRCVRAIGALVWPTRKTNEAAAERPPLQRAA
jgi:hypothetical protein